MMRTFPFVFSLLLSSQAFSATALNDEKVQRRLVRNDGTSKAYASTLTASDVAMDISATGEVEPAKKAYKATSRGQKLLSEVQKMARSGATPEPDKIKVIESLVNDELLPDLTANHATQVSELGLEHDAIAACNKGATDSITDISGTVEVKVGQRRTEHSSCREDEKEKSGTQKEKCDELDAFLDKVVVPANLPAGRPRDGMVDYVTTMSTYFCPKGPTVTDLDNACTEAENANAEHKAKCDRHQASFESGFCQWRADLLNTCATLGQCYTTTVAAYNAFVTDTKALVAKWKVEFSSLKKILCYTGVWLNAGANEIDAAQYDTCNNAEIDTSPMDVTYPEVPAQATCDTTAVDTFPGEDAFKQAEYAEFLDFVNDMLSCIGHIETPQKPAA